MAKITYPQQLPEDANLIKHVSIGQTRDGKDEFITPVTIWEVDKDTGLHVPPGAAEEVNAPRVKLDTDAQTTLEAVQAELELVKSELQTIKSNQLSGNQKVTLSGTMVELSSMSSADRPDYTTITQPTMFVLLNSSLSCWVTDGSADWVEV